MSIQQIIQSYPAKSEYLLEMLIAVDQQKKHHYISAEEINEIASYVKVKESHVCSVMSFYTLLSTQPRGEYVIQVCKDVPCYINDDFNVVLTIEEELGIVLGQTTNCGRFSLEQTACIGCCDEAPAMRINHEIYTNLTKEKVLDIIHTLRGDANGRTT
ncbi:complex I 24 kDa subunit family protein [Candidatus Xianfuyuplasma coldseepsis]|uniref:NAD(P)H-dependent oxidoreductase subunit E n=1 Tax=Candidatus Xianfuyuplasma coldseepsis TaxID=2782163 RepID=A0A7L7KRN4_9MOLU|nr:NAD(P)H-dependent oxidoreductase subunit E [Xianfuyuplasma coldseepsis]QMS85490.1 NAD(P)H-dependent oxidoreductase subunit E [Xianfuyuplasma coldseepsis]